MVVQAPTLLRFCISPAAVGPTTTRCTWSSPLFSSSSSSSSTTSPALEFYSSPSASTITSCGNWLISVREKQSNAGIHGNLIRCSAISKSPSHLVINWQEIIKQDNKEELEAYLKVAEEKKIITELIDVIKTMLSSMDDGEISVSAYDTAWVALVEDIINGCSTKDDDDEEAVHPQFPSTLQWIVNNQLSDGSWGDQRIFLTHDRILNTLACVIALKKWRMYPDKCEKGMLFIRENIHKLDEEKAEKMPIGFEVIFPSLIEISRNIGLEVLEDSHPVLQNLYAHRNLKLTRIPKEMMHVVPTTLLHSLEGMAGYLNWEKLLKLQSSDGSFLFSPASTAFALMQTKDQNCLKYLNRAVEKFHGGVPNVYPVDLFEHIWAVDRLERLGVSRYFQSEIEESLNYVSRYWTKDGICWARNSTVHDIDDTAMGFRLLRLHGHDVSADVFRRFEKDGEFFCFAGQSNQAVTGIFNLYRASQVLFPGENVLEEAKKFSSKFLRQKQASNQILDKWIIAKDLPGEVGYALDVPFYASLPRIETRFYIEHYGGEDDVWIGKTLYRMPYVNNNAYLELAKLDFNHCQALHKLEWVDFQRWYSEYNLSDIGVNGITSLLHAYFLATASIFEPERWIERLVWAKTSVLIHVISLYFSKSSAEKRTDFVKDFNENYNNNLERSSRRRRKKKKKKTATSRDRDDGIFVLDSLLGTLNQVSLDVLMAHGIDVRHHLRQAWETWMLTWRCKEDDDQEHQQQQHHYSSADLIVGTLIVVCRSGGRFFSEEVLSSHHPSQFDRLAFLTNRICHNLRRMPMPNNQHQQQDQVHGKQGNNNVNPNSITTNVQIESDMQELLYCALRCAEGVEREIAQTFLTVAKSYYYTSYCTQATINLHIDKVLFQQV